MKNTLRWILAITGVFIIVVALLWGGVTIGRAAWNRIGYGPGSMMGAYYPPTGQPVQNRTGSGMMNGSVGMMGGGMMGNFGTTALNGVKPLGIDQTKKAVDSYLAGRGNNDLIIGEVMIFDNQAYAMVTEKSTGIGAFELLVDPVTLAVSPEPGPNMMWNQKYGMMSGNSGYGMMGGAGARGFGGMMGSGVNGNANNTPEVTAQMPVNPTQAVQSAQRYLDTYLPGTKSEDKPDAFYGYYTLHILRDGNTVGMLSVNGYTGQVFLHTWHGNFIEISNN